MGAKDLVDLVVTARNEAQLEQALVRFRDEFGLAHAAYHALEAVHPDSEPIFVLTYPKDWVERYRERNYFEIDPILINAPKADFPLDWAEVDRSSPEISEFFGDAARHGVGRNGMTFPLRTITGERAAFTITSERDRAEWEAVRWEQARHVQRFAEAFHRRMIILRMGGEVTLSQKESECLRLLMEGLTPKSAAGVLGVSENRVRTILQQACRKLKCRTATQAVARAITYQMI
jgi:DNA-binding CsgD family transcriptional regulator